MKLLASLSLLALSMGAANAQQFDCAAQSQLAEPPGWADQCGPGAALQPSSAILPNLPTDTAFLVNLRSVPDQLLSFTINAFGTQTLRGNTAEPLFATDFDPTGTTYYAINNTTLELGTLNLTTGAFTLIATTTGLPVGQTIVGMAIHPRTGVAYVLAGGQLHTLNLTTGVATAVGGPLGGGTNLPIAIAMNCEGLMYMHDIGTDSIYTVDTTTGAATLVGATGVNSNFAQGMDFDNSDGILYAYTYQGAGANQFGSINLATGALTALSTNQVNVEAEGAIPTLCPPLNADVSITKTGPGGNVTIGSPVTYNLAVANAGPAAASGVVVTDALPAEVTYVSNTCGATVAGNTVTWTIGALANGANATCSITANVAQAGTIVNTATVATTSTDPATANNTSSATITGGAAQADLSLTKTAAAPATFTIGASITYTLTVANAGPAGATAVVVTDPLPANTTYVSNTCGATAAGNTVTWNVGALAAAANATCGITVTINAAGSINNTATATSGTADPVTANNAGSVILGGVPVVATSVPFASWQTLVLLVLGMLSLGLLVQRRA